MNKYPLSHMIRIQRVNRIRVPWLQKIGGEVAKLERVARAAKGAVRHMQMCGDESDAQRNLLKALREVEHLL